LLKEFFMPSPVKPLERESFEAAALMAQFPPKLQNRNKQVIYQIACPQGSSPAGSVTYSRWGAMSLPDHFERQPSLRLIASENAYDYRPIDDAGVATEWHVNFADSHLFVAYGSGLFAQDEIQVAEHPVLASVKEAISARGKSPRTMENGSPTPVLIKGAERRVVITTDPDFYAGRAYWLYGSRFTQASEEVITAATKPINPPTVTNILAMAAPASGEGTYQREEIELILETAYTGFMAAKMESGTPDRAVIHTGFWGCGAFGGNRVLMAMLQIIAAHFAGIDAIAFHTFNKDGTRALADAQSLLGPFMIDGGLSTGELIGKMVALGLRWGISDGN
jgi:hypothetical protein